MLNSNPQIFFFKFIKKIIDEKKCGPKMLNSGPQNLFYKFTKENIEIFFINRIVYLGRGCPISQKTHTSSSI